ncbi:sodium-independent sulfate anion transporter-like isoform X2 [Centruroides vittatus]|uniref:sodium-independent sulfate anion transporter-like isoform X2 n=1 Tax=Centruroides vittatus TaxID=120091 RepID=UPI00350F7D75
MKKSANVNIEMRGENKGENEHCNEEVPLQDENSYSHHFRKMVKSFCRDCCSMKTLKKRIPIIGWLPNYSLAYLKGDAVAGLTVALTVIPQGLALAQIAHLPPQYGLYTAFMGCFMYTIFGSCKDLTIGPTAIMSLMTAEYVGAGGIPYVLIMTFLSGCLQLLMGILHLGFLVNFISASVISGFTSAAAITIASTQLAGLLGVKVKSQEFFTSIYEIFSKIHTANYWDTIMGISCVIILLLLRYFRELKFRENSTITPKLKKVLSTVWWMITTGKNALIVLICGGLASILLIYNISPFTLTQVIKAGLPPFEPPPFSVDVYDNSTNKTEHKDFIRIVQDLRIGVIMIPVISILEAIAIAKAFAKGKKLDASQEMIALGIGNIMGSFVSSFPATGSFSRTAINYSSGVKTQFGGVFTGTTVILALCVLSPYFRYIPKPSLSAIIIVAVLNMVHYKDIPVMWKTNKLDLLPFLATFICSFVIGLEYGIIIGMSFALMIILFQQARPKITFKDKLTSQGQNYLFVQPDRTVLFPATDYLTSKITQKLPVINGEYIISCDYTMAVAMKNMIENFSKMNIITVFVNLKQHVIDTIKGANPIVFHYCPSESHIEELFQSYLNRNAEWVRDLPVSINRQEPDGKLDQDTLEYLLDSNNS